MLHRRVTIRIAIGARSFGAATNTKATQRMGRKRGAIVAHVASWR